MKVSWFSIVMLLGCSEGLAPADPEDSGMPPMPADASVAVDASPDPMSDAFVEEEPLPDLGPEPEEPEEPEPPVEEEEPDPEEGGPGFRVVHATYKVMHWNIAGGKENDCRADLIARAVVRFARERSVDFIGLNEICRSQFVAIRDQLQAHWGKSRAFARWAQGSRRTGNAILSRFDLSEFTDHHLGEDRYGDRILLCARVRNRPHVRFCSTHLSPTSEARPQLAIVRQRIERWWENQHDTVILSGDFNLESNRAALDTMYSADADSRHNPDNRGAYRELDDADRDQCLGYGENTGLRRTGGACGNGRRIDHIFVRQNRIVRDRYGSDALNIPTDCTGRCSDHRPVFGWARVKVRIDD